ncbi:F-box protein SKIP28 [Carica papaya]|uniref:F-box protein SKIP28 n=1 Tax=Carica papaya TaxID=3649 RepID=UPI000B8CAD98|nr:F-box protein SKIP28 [Carica papaya]
MSNYQPSTSSSADPNLGSLGPEYRTQVAEPESEPVSVPHEVMLLLLAYLPLYELLAMSQVCVLLRDAVNEEVLPWLNVVVDRTLSSRLTDEILIKVTSKANGRLATLALMDCVKITDDGLRRVAETNPLINKLCLTGCTRLTPEGVIRAVKTLSDHHPHSLTTLQINGIYDINKHHLQTLRSFLPLNTELQLKQPLLFYHTYRNPKSPGHWQSLRVIDVEVCRLCEEVRMVFDCPRESCKRRECRGCSFCIQRCEECGGCVEYGEEEEAACSDVLCSACWLQLPKCDVCNKPYCKTHTSLGYSASASAGFICDVCRAKFIQSLCDDLEF